MNEILTFRDGAEVIRLGQGTWYMGEDASKRQEEIKALQYGIELGMNVIDTAEMYGDGSSEKLVGEAIRGKRENVFLISKVLPWHASSKGTIAACEGSLQRLKTDHLDLYLLHWQGEYPFEETLEGMMELIRQGKIRRWGVSNMDVDEMEKFYSITNGDTCAANEVLYNLSRRGVEYDLLPWCKKKKLPVIAYSPIEQGRILNNEALMDIADKHQVTPSQVALNWVLRNPDVIAIPKAGRVEHVESNYKCLSLVLDSEDYQALDRAFPPPTQKKRLEML